jgi:hypothetical protein
MKQEILIIYDLNCPNEWPEHLGFNSDLMNVARQEGISSV